MMGSGQSAFSHCRKEHEFFPSFQYILLDGFSETLTLSLSQKMKNMGKMLKSKCLIVSMKLSLCTNKIFQQLFECLKYARLSSRN